MQSSEEKLTAHVSSPAGSQGPGNTHICSAGVRTALVQVKTPLPSVCFGPLPIPERRQVIRALHCAGLSGSLRTLQPIFAQQISGWASGSCKFAGST